MKGKAVTVSCLVLLLSSCGADDSNSSTSGSSYFWDGSGDVHGSPAFAFYPERELSAIIASADLVAVLEITEIQSVKRSGFLPETPIFLDPADEKEFESFAPIAADAPESTFYSATVEESLKGSGSGKIKIRGSGGLYSDGTPSFTDGDFLLEPGRRYVLALFLDNSGEFYTFSGARSGFDLTAGVKVLNHPDTRDLEPLEGLSEQAFVEYVRQLTNSGDTGPES